MSSTTIGIDFGTTTSSMAWVDPRTGEARIIKNAEGHIVTHKSAGSMGPPDAHWLGSRGGR